MKPGAVEAAIPSPAVGSMIATVGAGPCAVFGEADETIWANPAALALLGSIGKSAFGAAADRHCALATGRGARRRIEIDHGGQGRTFILRVAPVPGEAGQVFCSLTDVSGEARAMKALREVTQRASEFVSLVSDCVWETDAAWRITHFSLRDAKPAATKALIGRSVFEIGAFAEAERGARPPTPRRRAIFREAAFRIRLEETERILLLTGMPLFAEDTGAFVGYRGAGEDATARLRAEGEAETAREELLRTLEDLSVRNRELDRALAEAQSADLAKDEFLARMSHELRTPLNAVLGLSSILEASAGDRLDEQQRRFVSEIRNAGRHLLSLVEDVLEYAQASVSDVKLRREALDLGEIAREAMSFLRMSAEERGLVLEARTGAALTMTGDRTRLRQVFINLLHNAVKFSPSGGAVTLTAFREGDRLFASVRDEGPGVPPELTGRVFDPFFQVDGGESRSHGGVGLGLALCRQFVSWHQGEIRFLNAPEGGAVVEIALPAAEAAAAA